MSGFVVRRVLQAVVSLFIVSILVFLSARVTGSPETTMLPVDATAEMRATFRTSYGLDRPVLEQYTRWLALAIRGDFGDSIQFRQPVVALIGPRLRNSLALAAVSVAFAAVVAIPLGVLAAARRGTALDRFASGFGVAGIALPPFWLGIVLVLIFAVHLDWFPASGMAGWRSFVLPAFSLGFFVAGGALRLMRSSMIEALQRDYIVLARAKGVPERNVYWKHAFVNAVRPVVTFLGYMFGVVIAAAIAVETVFNWPGVGRLVYDALIQRDFPLVQAVVLVAATMLIASNSVVDVLYRYLDPQLRVR